MIRLLGPPLLAAGALAALAIAVDAWRAPRVPQDDLAAREAELVTGRPAAEPLRDALERLAARRRATGLWERWNDALLERLERRPASAPSAAAAAAETGATPVEVVPLPPPASLTAEAEPRGDRVDVRLGWIAEGPAGFGAPVPRFDVWRWREPGGRPQRLASAVEGTTWLDAGLPGGHRVVYAVYAVTADERFSRSTGSTVRVELPRVFAVELPDPPLATEDAPPPVDAAEVRLGPPPAEPPAEITLRVRRVDGLDAEDVVVRAGETVGRRFATGFVLERLEWVRTLRPVRFLEPVFEDDGSVVLEDGEPKVRPRVHHLETYRAAGVLVDAWGAETRISPPPAPARN